MVGRNSENWRSGSTEIQVIDQDDEADSKINNKNSKLEQQNL